LRGLNSCEFSYHHLSWLRGIAANVRRNQLRSARRLSQREATGNGKLDTAASPDPFADTKERDEQIAAALDDLLERQESVLRAKYFDGLSVAEIAAAWNETPKAIESLLSRSRDAFRRSISSCGRGYQNACCRLGVGGRGFRSSIVRPGENPSWNSWMPHVLLTEGIKPPRSPRKIFHPFSG
jgi:RNA polymerase sigma factor (sigma-70 family)